MSEGGRLDFCLFLSRRFQSKWKGSISSKSCIWNSRGARRDGRPGWRHSGCPHADGVQVHDGILEARAPGGVLRYRPTPATTQEVTLADSHLSLVLQALSDFHYNTLKLGIQYEEDGTLRLTARLEGKNPGLAARTSGPLQPHCPGECPGALKKLTGRAGYWAIAPRAIAAALTARDACRLTRKATR